MAVLSEATSARSLGRFDAVAELSARRSVLVRELGSYVDDDHLRERSSRVLALQLGRALAIVTVDAEVLAPAANRRGLLRVRTAACIEGPARLLAHLDERASSDTCGTERSTVIDLRRLLERGEELAAAVSSCLEPDDLAAINSILGGKTGSSGEPRHRARRGSLPRVGSFGTSPAGDPFGGPLEKASP